MIAKDGADPEKIGNGMLSGIPRQFSEHRDNAGTRSNMGSERLIQAVLRLRLRQPVALNLYTD